MSETPQAKNGPKRRKLRNFLLQPAFQLKYGLYFMGMGLLVQAVVFSLLVFTLSDIIRSLSAISDLEIELQNALSKGMVVAWAMFGILFIVFSGMSFALAIVITHRVVGPMVPIRRHIQQLKEGKYGVQTSLREHDELKPLMDDLNVLSQTLAEKHGAGATPTKASSEH